MAGGYEGRGGVADDRHQHLGQRAGVAAGEVRHGEDGDAPEAEAETGDPAGADPFRGAEERARSTPTIGTPAISSPAVELDRCRSASVRVHQGPMISITAKASTGFQ